LVGCQQWTPDATGPASAPTTPAATATPLPDEAQWRRLMFRMSFHDRSGWLSIAIPPGWVLVPQGDVAGPRVALRSACRSLDYTALDEQCPDSELWGRLEIDAAPADEAGRTDAATRLTVLVDGRPAQRHNYPTIDPGRPPFISGPRGFETSLVHDGLTYTFQASLQGWRETLAETRPYLDALDQIISTVRFGPPPSEFGEWAKIVIAAPVPPATPSGIRSDLSPATYSWSFSHPSDWEAALSGDRTWTLQAPAGAALSAGPMTLRGEPLPDAPEDPYGDGITAFQPILGGWGYRLPDEVTATGLRWRWISELTGESWQVTAEVPPLDPDSDAYDLYLIAALTALADSGFGYHQPIPPGYPGPAPASIP
jgi:hypothetical protein